MVTVCALCAVCAVRAQRHGTLANGVSKMKTLKRLRAQGSVEAREVPTHNRIAEESAAKPLLPSD